MSCTNHADVISGIVACARCGLPFCQDCVVQLDGHPYDAACKDEVIRDLRSGSAGLAYGSIGRRIGAYLLDSFLCLIPAIVLLFAGSRAVTSGYRWFPRLGFGEYLALLTSIPFFLAVYEGVFLSYDGRTPGKRLLGLRVVNRDGSELRAGRALSRAGVRLAISVIPMMIMFDLLLIFSEGHRTLHDRISGTLVERLPAVTGW